MSSLIYFRGKKLLLILYKMAEFAYMFLLIDKLYIWEFNYEFERNEYMETNLLKAHLSVQKREQ